MTAKLKRVQITIQTRSGAKKILAWPVGKFLAVHPSWDDEPGWTVTHVPTGRAILTWVYTKAEAKRAARHLDASGARLDFTVPELPKKQRAALASFVEAARKAGLGK